ncbi:MAG TPA: hypothetical protein K8V84_17445 [Nocardiopsis listeri]|uniref:hypothetical protein n=1 Tax=Nocardiopsis listeri TaxID=53440 RepID=UPI001D2CF750|nr:hypothetical protein [Nocardiopsis listeri]HJE60270.1 hypothetical protein [Nocardiopsis listeri]
MPRLSHTLDLDALKREDVTGSIDGVHRVLREARFDDEGHLLVPDEAERKRLERRAEELGVIHGGETAEAEPDMEHSLRLLSGEHLTPGAHYLLSVLDENGDPDFSEEVEGWVGTDLTITSWDPQGRCSLDFAMREDPAVTGFEESVTSGTVVHDRDARTLSVHARMRFPAPMSIVGENSSLLRVNVDLHVDLPRWYAALSGTEGTAPLRFEVGHPFVRAVGEALPSPAPDGRWSVTGSLEVRGRGPARPLVAVAAWAMLRSMRRSEEMSVERWVAEVERSWADTARSLPALPGLLDEVAEAVAVSRVRRPTR